MASQVGILIGIPVLVVIKWQYKCDSGWFMVLNANFNNMSVISWRSVLLEETGVLGENHRLAASH
jgi:prepilin signal peptidase PulO-like enzyme (type II secretory pathway)